MRTYLRNENLLHTFSLSISQCEYSKLNWHIKQQIDAPVNSKSIPLPTSNFRALKEFGALEDWDHRETAHATPPLSQH